MTAHELAALLLSCPNLPVRIIDYEGHTVEITGRVDPPSYQLNDKPVIELSIQHI